MIKDFIFNTPTKVVFGRNAEDKAGELVKEFGGKKVLVHYGTGSVVRSGLLAKSIAALDACGIDHIELGGAVPNPRLGLVYEGIELCKKEGVDFILAVGGGSAIDSAKAIAYGAVCDGDVWDFFSGKVPEACLPLGCILTLAATGTEMSDSAVITKEEGLLKRSANYDISRPKFAVMNPELTMTLPDYQTASGCVDIMMHTLDRYFDSPGSMELTDNIAETLLRTVMKYAKVLVDDPKNYDARAEIMWAGSISHNGLMQCGSGGGDWCPHKLEHELGALYDVAHGAGLAAVWGSWARYVLDARPERFARLAVNVFGISPKAEDEETALLGIAAMEDFFRSINMPTNLRELGVEPAEGDYRLMAEKMLGGNEYTGTFKPLSVDDAEKIFRMAY